MRILWLLTSLPSSSSSHQYLLAKLFFPSFMLLQLHWSPCCLRTPRDNSEMTGAFSLAVPSTWDAPTPESTRTDPWFHAVFSLMSPISHCNTTLSFLFLAFLFFSQLLPIGFANTWSIIYFTCECPYCFSYYY